MPYRTCIVKDWLRLFEDNNSLCAEALAASEKPSFQNEANVGYFLMFASSTCLHIWHSLSVKRLMIGGCTVQDF
jgi:hypothetical protein